MWWLKIITKKAEGRMTTFVLGFTVILSVLMLFSSLMVNVVTSYGTEDVTEFEQYRTIYNEFNSSSRKR